MPAFRLRRRDRSEPEGEPDIARASETGAAEDWFANPDNADVESDASAGAQPVSSAGDDGDPDSGSHADGEGEWLAYELHEWALEARVMLQQLLTLDQVVHSWQGTTLLVHESLEETVDALVEEVEEAQDAATGSIGDEEELTAYEIGEWPPEVRTELVRRLQEARIPHVIDEPGASELDIAPDTEGDEAGERRAAAAPDSHVTVHAERIAGEPDAAAPEDTSGGDHAEQDDEPDADEVASRCDLLVREVDEQRVELVIDDLLAQVEDAGLEELEGLEANDLLGAVFAACDRLRREPREVEGARALAAAGERLSAVRAPFGFSASNWRSLQRSVSDLLELMADPEADLDDVRDSAGRMSDSLKSLI